MTELTRMVTPAQGKTGAALDLAKASAYGSGFVLLATAGSKLIEPTAFDPSNTALNCALAAAFATNALGVFAYAGLRFSGFTPGEHPHKLARIFGFAAGALLPLGVTAAITSAPAQPAPVAYVAPQDQDGAGHDPMRGLICRLSPTRPECDFHPLREM